MSGEHSYDFRLERENERARIAALIQMRRLEQARLYHQQASAQLAATRQAIAGLQSQLGGQAAALTDLKRQGAALEQDLAAQARALESAERRLQETRATLQDQINATRALDVRAERERRLLTQAIGEAQSGLAVTAQSAAAGERQAVALQSASAGARALADEQAAIGARLDQVERELRFIDRHPETRPAAMVVLAGMQANGYALQETLTGGELTAYFARADADHQVAVRLVPDCRPGEQPARWDLLAETFGLGGPVCLDVLEDFDTAIETLDLGQLVAKGPLRNYPKAERSGALERPGSLPAPAAALRRVKGPAAGATLKG